MRRRLADEDISNWAGEPRHVLIVVEHGNPLRVLVRRHALEALEHFVAFDGDTACARMPFGQKRAPQGVRVQYGARSPNVHDLEMEPRFCRRPAGRVSDDAALAVDLDGLI